MIHMQVQMENQEMLNNVIDYIKDNPDKIYHVVGILGGLITCFISLKRILSKTRFLDLIKLITEVPSSIIDIKEGQKEIFSEIKLQSKVINAILETLELAQFLCDSEGKCIKVNSKWISLTGLSEEEAHGHNWLLSVHHEDRENIQEKWIEMIENNCPFEEVFRYQHRVTGIITKVKCTATDVVDENNQRLFILGLSRVL